MSPSRPVRILAAVLAVSLCCALPALAGSRIEKQLRLAPGGEFVLDTAMGSVTVRGGAADGARVVITSRRDDLESHATISFDDGEDRAVVRVEKKPGLSSWFRRDPGLEFDIELPADTALNVETSGGSIEVAGHRGALNADTSGGSIRVSGVDGDVTADTSGGSITVERVSGSVKADTSGGSIRMSEIAGGISAETSGGSIRIEEAGAHVVAETSGGPVEVRFAAGNGSGGKLSTSGGGVTVYLDPSVGLDVDASTSGGTVELDVPLTVQGKISKSAVRGTLGDGGSTLLLRSSGGGIRVRER